MKERIILSSSRLGDFKTFNTILGDNLTGRHFSIIITHVVDLDGLFCGLLADRNISIDTIIIPLSNSADKWLINCLDHIIEKGIIVDEMYVTDIGLLDETHRFIGLKFMNTYKLYIDHHSSALEQQVIIDSIYNKVIINTAYSATVNCFNLIKEGNGPAVADLERYVRFVNDRDLWLLQYPQSDRLASLYKIFFFYKMFDYICSGEELMDVNGNISDKYDFVLDLEMEKVVSESKRYMSFMKTAVRCKIKFGYALYTGNNASDIAEYFRKNKPEMFEDVDVLAFIMNDSISLRVVSDCGFDVSAFAKERNGGGHVKAAGYPLNNQDIMIDKFIASLFKY